MNTLKKLSVAGLVVGALAATAVIIPSEETVDLVDVESTKAMVDKGARRKTKVQNQRDSRSLYRNKLFLTSKEPHKANEVLSNSLCLPLLKVSKQVFQDCLSDQKESAWIKRCGGDGKEIDYFVIIRLNDFQLDRLTNMNKGVMTVSTNQPKIRYCVSEEMKKEEL
jgi:ABC-type uncharacterized transport system auxiliary subunit